MAAKAVLFDFGNTLVSYYRKEEFDSVLERCIKNAADYLKPHGLFYEHDVILASAREYNTEREDLKVTPIENRLAALFSLTATHQNLMPGLVDAFMAPNLAAAKVSDGCRETLEKIREKNLYTGIISNLPWGSPPSPWTSQLEILGLLELFDDITYCMDVGFRKPHPAIFEAALNKAGVLAEEAIFIGDDPIWDVKGALDAGIQALLYDPEESEYASSVPVIRHMRQVLDYC